ncbi:unnamed protein product [Allacma fusca]|uniref:Methyltransferase type 11 domain-containing protein n=1 Tax=Allacma fusca TaxID=39272 RepID=A0A8J2LYH1_9HEXA|nr:unnamed protein product [Allacma fusca]
MFIEEHVPVMVEKMNWKPFESILDYGCGAGSVSSHFLFPIAEKYSSAVTGVDVSPEMVEYANENHSHALANFLVGNIMVDDKFKWPLQNVKFDKILVVNVVHFIQDYEEFFKRIVDQLNKGGQLACGIPFAKYQRIHHNLSEHPKWRKYMGVMKKVRASWAYDDNLDFPSSVKSILESLGLKIIDFYSYEAPYLFPSVNEFTDFVIATNLGAKNVPAELKKELREEIGRQGAEIMEISPLSKPFQITSKYLRFVVEK